MDAERRGLLMVAVQRDSMPVLLICLVLVGIGLVMVYSSSSVLAAVRFGDSSLFLKKQSIRVLIGKIGRASCRERV